jgi:hypothetical protein
MSKLQKKPSALKRGHPTLQNMNFYKFLSNFVGHFCPPGSGSGSTDPIESGSNPDPDPQPFLIPHISRRYVRYRTEKAVTMSFSMRCRN